MLDDCMMTKKNLSKMAKSLASTFNIKTPLPLCALTSQIIEEVNCLGQLDIEKTHTLCDDLLGDVKNALNSGHELDAIHNLLLAQCLSYQSIVAPVWSYSSSDSAEVTRDVLASYLLPKDVQSVHAKVENLKEFYSRMGGNVRVVDTSLDDELYLSFVVGSEQRFVSELGTLRVNFEDEKVESTTHIPRFDPSLKTHWPLSREFPQKVRPFNPEYSKLIFTPTQRASYVNSVLNE